MYIVVLEGSSDYISEALLSRGVQFDDRYFYTMLISDASSILQYIVYSYVGDDNGIRLELELPRYLSNELGAELDSDLNEVMVIVLSFIKKLLFSLVKYPDLTGCALSYHSHYNSRKSNDVVLRMYNHSIRNIPKHLNRNICEQISSTLDMLTENYR